MKRQDVLLGAVGVGGLARRCRMRLRRERRRRPGRRGCDRPDGEFVGHLRHEIDGNTPAVPDTAASAETLTPGEPSTPLDARTETSTPDPTPSRPPRQGVFARYDRSDQSGADVIHFRIDNANEYDVRVSLPVTW